VTNWGNCYPVNKNCIPICIRDPVSHWSVASSGIKCQSFIASVLSHFEAMVLCNCLYHFVTVIASFFFFFIFESALVANKAIY